MSEKQKPQIEETITLADVQALPDVPGAISLKSDSDNTSNKGIDYQWSLPQKIVYYMKRFKLDPSDLRVLKGELLILKSGWFKIADQNKIFPIKAEVVSTDWGNGRFVVKGIVFKEGTTHAYEAFGVCDRTERGRETKPNTQLFETADTRAKIRAIQLVCPLPVRSFDDAQEEEQAISQAATDVIAQGKEAARIAEEKKKKITTRKAIDDYANGPPPDVDPGKATPAAAPATPAVLPPPPAKIDYRAQLKGTGMTDAEIDVAVKKQIDDLGGLIDEEGVLQVLCKEKGIGIPPPMQFNSPTAQEGLRLYQIADFADRDKKDGSGKYFWFKLQPLNANMDNDGPQIPASSFDYSEELKPKLKKGGVIRTRLKSKGQYTNIDGKIEVVS